MSMERSTDQIIVLSMTRCMVQGVYGTGYTDTAQCIVWSMYRAR